METTVKTQTKDVWSWAISSILIIVLAGLASDNSWPSDRDDDSVEQSQDQLQGQDQGQDQGQAQDQFQEQSSEQANQQTTNVSSDFVSIGASSGDSSSTCQKVRDIRFFDAFGLGFRWDMTDKDCRRLDLADAHYARGNTYFADTLTCSTPFVLDTFGDVNACKEALERNDVVAALKKRVANLEADNRALNEERQYDRIQCENSKARLQSENERIEENCTK